MKRMNNKEVKQMLTFFSSSIDFENLNLDDEKNLRTVPKRRD